jgi:hypothetical protein
MPLYIEDLEDKYGNKSRMFLTGDLGPHCRDCAAVGILLCDFPIGDGKTCDAALCSRHGTEVAPDIHYCPGHYEQWKEWRETAGIDDALRNVIPFFRRGTAPQRGGN